MTVDPRRDRRRSVVALGAAVAGFVATPRIAMAAPAAAELSAILSSGPPLPALQPAQLVYSLYYGAISRDAAVAEASYTIETSADRYRIGTEGKAIGLVALFYSGTLTQRSEGRTGPAGLAPEHYVEQRGRRPQRELRFDPDRQRMVPAGGDGEVASPHGTQDRLSVFFQLGLLARGRPALFEAGRAFRMPLASMRRIDRPTFRIVGPQRLRTGAGVQDTLQITVRNEADPTDPVFDIWLATSQAMLPARIRMTENDGKLIDQVLSRTL